MCRLEARFMDASSPIRLVQDASGEFLQTTTPAGLRLIGTLEGDELVGYPDATGTPTIGRGHTGAYPDIVREMHPELGEVVAVGDEISAEASILLLMHDIARFERCVRDSVHVPLTSYQFDACVSLAFNIGEGSRARQGFSNSTLVALLNRREYEAAADEFPKWRRSGGRVLDGLVNRRAVERLLFLEGLYDFTPYDGDFSDATLPREERAAPVEAPPTERRADMRDSTTRRDATQGGLAALLAGAAVIAQTVQETTEQIFGQPLPGWALGAVGVGAIAVSLWKFGRVNNERERRWTEGYA